MRARKPADSEPEYADGGFGAAPGIRSQMSDALQRRLAADDAREQREATERERERAHHADVQRERAIQSLVAQAIERGDGVTMHQRMTGEGLGNTPAEFIEQRAAIMDLEDAQLEARRRAEFREWQLQQSADHTHDTSDAELETATQRAHHETWGPRVAEQRRQRREMNTIARAQVNRALGRGVWGGLR